MRNILLLNENKIPGLLGSIFDFGELWIFRTFFDFIDRWMGGCGMNKEGFLILLELCTVYFAFQYAAVFDPAAGFQARRLLV